MLWTIAIILFVLWVMGYSFKFGGNLIHTLLVVVLVLVIVKLLG